MTLLIASIAEPDAEQMNCAAEAAWHAGAEAVELRIDAQKGEIAPIAAYVRRNPHRTWIITCRREADGGGFKGTVGEQVQRLLDIAAGPNCFIDFEFHQIQAGGPDIARLQGDLAARGAHLMPSQHLAQWTAESLADLAARMSRVRPPVFKIAYAASDAAQGFPAADLMRQYGKRVIAIAMGEECAWTRVLARKLGAFGTFCSPNTAASTAPGQLNLADMIDRFRWREIDEATAVYGVVGDPVGHSLSPGLFSHWFAKHRVNAVYLRLHVRRAAASNDVIRCQDAGRAIGAGNAHAAVRPCGGVADFLAGCHSRPWIGVRGLSVTIPHKEAARVWLGELADSMSRTIGAVNTLCLRGGAASGHNTDCYAAVDSLAAALGSHRIGLAGKRIGVLGAGGAARAVITGLVEMGCGVTVFARDSSASAALARELTCAAAPWESRGTVQADVLVNTTPVGMWPQVGESPMPADRLGGYALVFDMIYRPAATQLLLDAAAAGCRTLNGLDMFVRQAAMQFELWTGISPDQPEAQTRLKIE